jgi:hypothetical protein
MLFIRTWGFPGVHGATVIGTHGIGVSTPRAAVVAAATTGLVGDVHIPKVGMFTTGANAVIFAASILLAMTGGPVGMTISEAGARPKGHAIMAPITTC